MIIGISGKKKHGKDTLCSIIQYLAVKYRPEGSIGWEIDSLIKRLEAKEDMSYLNNYIWYKRMFAFKLKQIVCLLINCTMEQLEDQNFKERELGETWRVYYWSHYKYPTQLGKISDIYFTEEEAENLRIGSHTIIEYFGTGSRIDTYVLTPRLLLQLIGTECGRKIIHPNIWINALMGEYDNSIRFKDSSGANWEMKYNPEWDGEVNQWTPNWIITDVRFPYGGDEAGAIKKRGGIVIRINRPELTRQYDRTCLDCYKGFDFEEAYTPDENKKEHYYCPYCHSPKHAGVFLELDTHESETAMDNYQHFDAIITNDGSIEELVEKTKVELIRLKIINV